MYSKSKVVWLLSCLSVQYTYEDIHIYIDLIIVYALSIVRLIDAILPELVLDLQYIYRVINGCNFT